MVLTQPGIPVHNGTHVSFSTDLGSVSPTDVTTVNGVATAQFSGNGQSGVADVHATSGAAKDPAATTTSGVGSTIKLTVGGAAAARVLVTANPSRVSANGGSSTITATVSDANTNPLIGVNVVFTTDNGTVSNAVALTNSIGQATTTLTTTTTATVTATVGPTGTGAVTPGTVKVTVTALPDITIAAATGSTLVQGQPVSFTITVTPGASSDVFQSIVVNFGDGSTSGTLGGGTTSVSHTYNSPGTYTVSATGTGVSGDSKPTSTIIVVGPATPIGVNLSSTPPSGTPGAGNTVIFTFLATVTPSTTPVQSYAWNFGTGANPPSATTTGNQASASYVSTGGRIPVTVTVVVTPTSGPNGNASVVIAP
jgi:hypothetical protein